MNAICASILLLTTLWLVGLILYQAWRGTVDLLSVRNFVLLGFIIFQLVSGAASLWSDQYGDVNVTDQPRVGVIFTLACLGFLGSVLWVYRWDRAAGAFASRLAANTASPGPSSLLVLALGFLGSGLVLRFGLVYIPLLGPAMNAIGTGLILVSVSMAAWAYAPRLWNPAVAIFAGAIALVALFSVLAGAFGRRDLVAFVGAAIWGAYHGHWKHLGFRAVGLRLAAFGFAGLILFGAMTATRQYDRLVYSPGEIFGRLTSRSPWQGLVDLTTGQWAAANSMYLIETRPERVPYDTLHSARYALLHPIPRAIFPAKPGSLGLAMPHEVHMTNVSKDLTFGPGIIGHIWNDNPWLAFPLYVLVIGLTLRVLDELIRRAPYNPFVVLPIAVGVGEFVALARGELGLFYVRAVAYILGAWVAMSVIGKVFRMLGWVAPVEPAPVEPDGWTDDPDWDEEGELDGAAPAYAGADDAESPHDR